MRLRSLRLSLAAAMLLGATLITGCTIRMQFYPVQGPLASAIPSPVFVGKLTGAPGTKSGSFSVVLGEGETFAGRWEMVPRKAQGANGGPEDMGSAWDLVYGQGFYVAHVLGEAQYGRAVVTGSKGTVLETEIFSPGPGVAKAVAKDDKGNIYKVVPSA